MIAFKPFRKVTLDDAKYVVRNVFGENACKGLETMILNPALEEVPGSDCGEVLYIDGKPAGFNAAILRKMYYKNVPFWGIAGSTLCLLPEARKEMACVDLMKKIVAPRFGSKMFFGNSANKKGLRITRAFGVDGEVPVTTAQKRIAVLRPFRFAMYLLKSRLLKISGYSACPPKPISATSCVVDLAGFKVKVFDESFDDVVDGFWKEYLSTNRGYVCSRTAKVLRWMLGNRLKTGRIFAVGAYLRDSLKGYVVFSTGDNARAWRVWDLIAINNDTSILSVVLRGGLKLIKQLTPAVHCEITGFPDFAQDVIQENFSIRRELSNNQFTWKFHGEGAPTLDELNNNSSWFFGPYDGDLCMFL